jgi:aspartyl-tRNA(Asn)/glutamyl-tRNA(Gln) amidotransferase subunit B
MYDASTARTYRLRTKESGWDYRFFPEPDLPPLVIDAVRVCGGVGS